MNLVRKILIVHGDTSTRRQLVLLHAGLGFDVRAFPSAATAEADARDEWFDLAIVAHDLPDAPDFAFVATLRKIQPTVPVLVLAREIELSLVIQGIRLGVADVLLETDDLRLVGRSVRSLLRFEADDNNELTAEELAQADRALERMDAAAHSADPFGIHIEAPSSDLLRLAKEKTLLEAQVERLGHEHAALEAQLKMLLAQNADVARLQAESAELHSQRELVTAAQTAIDQKARMLAGQREELARERQEFAAEREKLAAAAPSPNDAVLARERAELTEWRLKLIEEAEHQQAETLRHQQERMQLVLERRRWNEDLEVLRQQEENLRSYEARLRELQAQLEADRVAWCGANLKPVSHSPFTDDAALREAWSKLQRASEILETERTHFHEEKLALRDWEKALKQREESLGMKEAKVADREQRLRELIPPPKPAIDPISPARSFTRAPFAAARAMFGKTK